jgi:uncharacterized protein
MDTINFENVKRYILQRLERELSPLFVYHNIFHTINEVLTNSELLAGILGVTGEELLLLQTAALYHDLGFVVQAEGHESIGANFARLTLPEFGYNRGQIEVIQGIIMATRLPQTPHNLLEEIIADADLSVLGQKEFWQRNEDLRVELVFNGKPAPDDEEWYYKQLKFLQEHTYFTEAAHRLREPQKQENITRLIQLLECRETVNFL